MSKNGQQRLWLEFFGGSAVGPLKKSPEGVNAFRALPVYETGYDLASNSKQYPSFPR